MNAPDSEMSELSIQCAELRAKLDRAEAACAAMREALKELYRVCVCGGSAPDATEVAMKAIELVKSTYAGRDWVRKEDVKPLVEALQRIRTGIIISNAKGEWVFETVNDALAAARAKGLA